MTLTKIQSSDACVEIAHDGAELKRWLVAGRDWLHRGDAHWWPRSSPLLFPVVGKSRNDQVRIGQQTYPMPMHGFAGRQVFELASATTDSALFRLTDNEATRGHYPYSFLLEVTYRLSARSIALEARIANTGDDEIPVAFGTHPAFLWPLPGGEGQPHFVRFDRDVSNQVPRITPDAHFMPETQPVEMSARDLPLGQGQCFTGRALCFLGQGQAVVRFGPKDGPYLQASGRGFRHLALWSKPRAPFLSIEHWTAHGEPVGADSDLSQRADMTILAPAQELRAGTLYEIQD